MARHSRPDTRTGFTLIELIVVIGVITVLIGVLLPAVQKVRDASARLSCTNNLKQLGLALQQYHNDNGSLPMGHRSLRNPAGLAYSGWTLSILPYLEQGSLYQNSLTAYRTNPLPFHTLSHPGLSTPVRLFACPADFRVPGPQVAQLSKELAALTSYLGVSGKDYSTRDGVLFQNSRVRIADITDGTSNTLMIGERPPSADVQFGWWYAGVGQRGTGSADIVLGVREQNLQPILKGSACGPGAYPFSPGRFDDPCAMFHFWSPHSGGANFTFADGSTHFLSYSANAQLPALASRAGGEVASIAE